MASKPDLQTTVAGMPLATCLYNASGPRSGTAAALQKIAKSQAGAVLSKSATLLSQNGNPQPRTWHSPDGLASFNSEGLPNNGIDYYISESTIDEAMGDAFDENKPYFVSLSGKTLEDNLKMLRKIAAAPTRRRISTLELNLACPNVIGKPIIAYDFDQMDRILAAVSNVYGLPPLGVKLPPYLDFQHFVTAAEVLNKHKSTVKYVASINTVGNAFAIDVHSEAPRISSNNGFAGLSGPAIKYTALANVRKLRELLDTDIDVIGVGGIRTGEDVFEMLLAGATACQVATAHWKEGTGCFERILSELREIMQSKGYNSVSDITGKLKPWSKEGAALSRKAERQTRRQPSSFLSSTHSSQAPDESQFYKMLSLVLAALLAILCADKWFHPHLLPSEES